MQDYVTNKNKKFSGQSLYPISNYLSYASLSSTYISYLAPFLACSEPKSFKEASQDEKWMEAMQQEINALEDNHTRKVVDLPKGKQAIDSRWIYKIKYHADGTVDKFKARLVAKGYTQQEELDYHDTFSVVAMMVTLRTIISTAASKNWPLIQMEVSNAFLQGDLFEKIYMHLP